MSHFSYTRPSWTSGTALYAAEMSELDVKTFKSINGDDGGTWAPGSVIDIGGAGMTVHLVGTSDIDATAVLDVYGGIDIKSSGGIECAGYSNFFGPTNFAFGSVYFGGVATFGSGSTLNVNDRLNGVDIVTSHLRVGTYLTIDVGATTSILGPLSVASVTHFGNDVYLEGGTSTVDLHVQGHLSVTGTATVSSLASCSGVGRVVRPGVFTIGSGAGTISPTVSTDYVGLNLTGTVELTIDDTGAVDGDEIYVVNKSNIQPMYVYNTVSSGHGLLALLGDSPGLSDAIRVKRISGLWYVIHLNHIP